MQGDNNNKNNKSNPSLDDSFEDLGDFKIPKDIEMQDLEKKEEIKSENLFTKKNKYDFSEEPINNKTFEKANFYDEDYEIIPKQNMEMQDLTKKTDLSNIEGAFAGKKTNIIGENIELKDMKPKKPETSVKKMGELKIDDNYIKNNGGKGR